MQALLTASSFGLMAALICLIALTATRLAAGFTRAHASLFGGIAASLIIMIAAFHILPEALGGHHLAWVFAIGGFLGGFALQYTIRQVSGGPRRTERMIALTPVLAIAAHSLLDGWTYAVTFSVDTMTGISAATGLIVHEFPEAVICFLLLQKAGLSDSRAMLWAFLASGATTAGTAFLGAPFTAGLSESVLSVLFAISAGLLLQVGLSHLLRQAKQSSLARTMPAILTGFFMASMFSILLSNSTFADTAHSHVTPVTDEGHDLDNNHP